MRRLKQIGSWLRLAVMLVQPFSREQSLTARRAIALRLLQRQADSITFTRNGFHWSTPVEGGVTGALFLGGAHEENNLDALVAWLDANSEKWRSAGKIVNVGANIGDTAIELNRRSGRKVIACEPVLSTFRHMQANVEHNGLADVIECRRVAVAPAEGEIKLAVVSDSTLCEVLSENGQGFGQIAGMTVESCPSLPLDSLARPEEVALTWSDTQGFEASVIESGVALWRAGVPLWVEVWVSGLEVHGGIDKFLDACTQHFTHFLPSAHLSEAPRPIAALTPLVREMARNPGRFDDVLLLNMNPAKAAASVAA